MINLFNNYYHTVFTDVIKNNSIFSQLQQIIVDASVAEDDPRIKRALLYIQTDFLHRRFHFTGDSDNVIVFFILLLHTVKFVRNFYSS